MVEEKARCVRQMNERHFLDNLWRRNANMKETEIRKTGHSILYLRATQWSDDFESKMRNRLIVGSIRYGLLGASGKPKYDRISDMIRRLEKYKETGNDESLVDVANLALCEFVEGTHPNKHFRSADDATHTKEVK